MAAEPTFYTQITSVKENYKTDSGAAAQVNLPLVTLPAGTVLFRGLKIPKAAEDSRYFYRDYLGNPEGEDAVCLSPIHNTFFYPFPYVAFGANDIGKTFNMMQIVVLVHSVNVVAAVSPSTFVRGVAKRYNGTAPWQRCSNFSGPQIHCHTPTATEADANTYDNCLNPDYQVRSGTRGWMALANLDSINPRTKRGATTTASDSPMGSFLKALDGQLPGEGSKALAWAYVDDNGNAGFPEIAIYPYRIHKGRRTITRYCPDDKTAMALIEKEATSDNLNYLPIAAFTKSGVVDMVNGHFTYKSVAGNAGSSDQAAILQHMYEYIKSLQKGISLPHYGDAKLTFDSRTGFFALDKVVAPIQLPLSKPVPYSSLLMPLDSPEGEKRALQYMLIFRSFLPEHFMERYPFVGNRPRAMIFNRYPVLSNLFQQLEMPVPATFSDPLGRASSLYRKEVGKKVVSGGSASSRGTRRRRSSGTPPPYVALFKSVWLKFRK